MMVLGIAVIGLWLVLCAVWAVMSIPGGLMANASGTFSTRAQMWMLTGLAVGQLVVAAAGVPLGLAVPWAESRSSLLWTFGGLLAAGVALQVVSVMLFFNFGQK
jgi:hypothetical protein